MAKDDKYQYEKNPWKNPYKGILKKDWHEKEWHEKKCNCNKCSPECERCRSMAAHPSSQPVVEPVLTVEEALEAYRKAKLAHITAQNNARKAKEALAALDKETIDTYSAEILAKAALERALNEEAKNNG